MPSPIQVRPPISTKRHAAEGPCSDDMYFLPSGLCVHIPVSPGLSNWVTGSRNEDQYVLKQAVQDEAAPQGRVTIRESADTGFSSKLAKQ